MWVWQRFEVIPCRFRCESGFVQFVASYVLLVLRGLSQCVKQPLPWLKEQSLDLGGEVVTKTNGESNIDWPIAQISSLTVICILLGDRKWAWKRHQWWPNEYSGTQTDSYEQPVQLMLEVLWEEVMHSPWDCSHLLCLHACTLMSTCMYSYVFLGTL